MSERGRRVLVVEDEANFRAGMCTFLRRRGFDVCEAATRRDARERLQSFTPDAVVLDLQLPDGVAHDLLAELCARVPRPRVVVLTGYGSIEAAVQSLKAGAENFLTKPIELAELAAQLAPLDPRRPEAPRRPSSHPDDPGPPFFGAAPASRRLHDDLARLAGSQVPVLILGETGTGKSVVARHLHAAGPRQGGAFVDVNCSALSRELVESELFGHERGAFTGAQGSREGLIEAADQGTLFLDEIADIDPSIQVKLLKVIEEKRIRRVGSTTERRIDMRVIAATNRDITDAIRDGTFRADLYFRLSTVTLTIPPLRSRPEDILPLARLLLARACAVADRGDVALSPAAERALVAHSWPGNVRELRNVLERALVLGTTSVLTEADIRLDAPASEPATSGTYRAAVRNAEVACIEQTLRSASGRVDEAAALLGIPRSTLYERIRRFGIDLPAYRAGRRPTNRMA